MTGPEETIGERVRRMRKLRDMSQHMLAVRCKVRREHISRIECNRVDVGMFVFIEVARALDVSLDWIAFGSGGNEA